MNELVHSELVAAMARAAVRLRKLEATHRDTPVVDSTSTVRLRLFRRITEARDQHSSWARLVALSEAWISSADGDDVPGVPE